MYQVENVKPKIVFVLGRPGSGKSTQSMNIAREYGFVHLSAGALLRSESENSASKNAEIITEHMKNGTTVPDEITRKLIETAMKNAQMNKFVIDGYPRDKNNLLGWKKEMDDKVDLLFIIHLDCLNIVSYNRCLRREMKGNEEIIKKRIEIFNKETRPVILYYQVLGIVKTIDANMNSFDEKVFNDIKEIFKRI